MGEQLKLSEVEVEKLRYLDDYYKIYNRGCRDFDLMCSQEIRTKFFVNNFIFQTKNGYFISTLGQECLSK